MPTFESGQILRAQDLNDLTVWDKLFDETKDSDGTFDFTPIPQTYSDLVLRVEGWVTGSGRTDTWLRFNSDSDSNYSFAVRGWDGSGTVVNDSNDGGTTLHFGVVGDVSKSVAEAVISNYTSSARTAVRSHGWWNTTGSTVDTQGTYIGGGEWFTPDAVTSVSVDSSGQVYVAGSRAILYGVV